jgi:hypothetical protein
MEVALKIRSEAEGVLAVGALLLGSDHAREVAHRVDLADRARSGPIQQATTIGTPSVDPTTAAGDHVLGDTAIDSARSMEMSESRRNKDRWPHGPRWSLRRRSTERRKSIEAGSMPSADPSIGFGEGTIELPMVDPIVQQSPDADAESAGTIDSVERQTAPGSIPSQTITGRGLDPFDPTRPKTDPTTASSSAARSGRSTRRRSIDELRAEAVDIIRTEGWSGDRITAEALRLALHCSPKRARQLREEFRNTNKRTTTTSGQSVA